MEPRNGLQSQLYLATRKKTFSERIREAVVDIVGDIIIVTLGSVVVLACMKIVVSVGQWALR